MQSCQQSSKGVLLGIYKGKVEYAEYIYDFKTNKNVEFTLIGDSETIITNCEYIIDSNKIYIKSLDKQEQDHIQYLTCNDTLIIQDDSCIKQMETPRTFCK